MTVFTSGSPVWILLIPVVPTILAFGIMALAESVRAKRKNSPTTWRRVLLKPKPWLP
jgi:hypothetical protein